VVECENIVWGLHLCKFEEICRPLDTERAGAIDLPILVHLQAWCQGFGVLAMGWWNLENLIMDESSRREYEWTCLDLYMLDSTGKQYLLKLSLKVDSLPSSILPLPTPPHPSKRMQHMLPIPSTSKLIFTQGFYVLHTFEGALVSIHRAYTVEKELKTLIHMCLLENPSKPCSHKMFAFRCIFIVSWQQRFLMWSWCRGQCLICGHTTDLLK
jgi:hypothetical protein